MSKPYFKIFFFDSINANFVALNPYIDDVSRTDLLSQIGIFSFLYPLTDPLAQYLVDRTEIEVYKLNQQDSYDFFVGGRISVIDKTIVGGDIILNVTCNNYLEEFAHEVTVPNVTYHNVPYSDILDPAYAKTFVRPSNWTVNTENTNEDLTYISSLQSSLQTFDIVTRQIGFRYRYEGNNINPRTISFGAFGQDSGKKLRQNPKNLTSSGNDILVIDSLSLTESTENIVNYLYVLGGGGDNGLNQLTLRDVDPLVVDANYPIQIDANIPNDDTVYDSGVFANTNTGPNNLIAYYLEDINSQSQYGVIKRPVVFSDILPTPASDEITDQDRQNAANELYKAARQYLLNNKDKHIVYNISARGDGEGLRVGDKINLKFKGVTKKIINNSPERIVYVDINEDLYIVEITTTWGSDGLQYSLTVSNKPFNLLSDSEIIASAIETVSDITRQRKGSVTTGMQSYKDSFDNTNPARFLWWIPPETVYIDYIKLKVRIRPFRAYARAMANTGNHTHIINIPSHTHNVTVNNHTHNVTVASHTHQMFNGLASEGGFSFGQYVRIQIPSGGQAILNVDSAGNFIGGRTSASGGGQTVTSANGGGQTVTSAGGGSSTQTSSSEGAHTHALQFGIFEETTIGQNIRISIDGFDLNATAEFGNAGWNTLGDKPATANQTYDILIAANQISQTAFDAITSVGEHSIEVTCNNANSGRAMVELFFFQQFYLSSR